MNLLPRLAWFTAMAGKRAPREDDAPDPADMGTAFGLDASMAEQEDAANPQTPPHVDDRLVRRPRR